MPLIGMNNQTEQLNQYNRPPLNSDLTSNI